MSQPTLLIPGLFCTARLYADQIPALWPFGPVTIAEHRGYDNIADIAKSILAAAPSTFALVGLSMGGYLAFELFRQAPQRISKLALLDTSARPDSPEHTRLRHVQIAEAQKGQLQDICHTAIPFLLHRPDDLRVRDIIFKMAEETGAEGFVRQQKAIIGRPDSRPLLSSIRCPTLVLVGEQDRLTPVAFAQEMADGISGSRLVVVPDCGHASTLEQPEITSKALSEWLGS